MMWGNGMGWGGWLLMTLTTVGFWALVVFGIVALFRGTGGCRPARARHRRRRQRRFSTSGSRAARSTPRSTARARACCRRPAERQPSAASPIAPPRKRRAR